MALHDALGYKDWDRAALIVAERLTSGPCDDRPQMDEVFMGSAPLHCAAQHGAPAELVQVLLQLHPEGASMATDDKYQRLPLHWAVAGEPGCGPGVYASWSLYTLTVIVPVVQRGGGQVAGARALLTMFSGVGWGGYTDAVALILGAHTEATAALDARGQTPLHLAETSGGAGGGGGSTGCRGEGGSAAAAVVRLLLEAAPEVALLADSASCLPLHLAAADGSPAQVGR
jgi:hypothetical protein